MEKYSNVGIVYHPCAISIIDETIRTEKRSDLTYSLIKSYRLLEKMKVIKPFLATDSEMLRAHSIEYLEKLKETNANSSGLDFDKFGLSYDCPPKNGLFKRAQLIYGSTMAAARAVCSGKVNTCINWFGGWHHGMRNKASGFCYVNDINGAIYYLSEQKKKVFYIDLDLHHGDGVELEFIKSSKVLTLSIHHYSAGFFPNTGGIENPLVFPERCAVNIPLPSQSGENDWLELIKYAIERLMTSFDPDIIVVQCGADALYNDPHKLLCLSQNAYLNALSYIQSFGKHQIILGGGGYNELETAKLWTRVTAQFTGETIEDDIPDDYKYFDLCGPGFTLHDSTIPGCIPLHDNQLNVIKKHIDTCAHEISKLSKISRISLPSRPNFRKRKIPLEL